MSRLIFLNICVSDLAASTSFYTSIGATKNDQYSDATASCMVFSDAIHVMLLLPEKIKQFMPPEKEIADSKKVSEVLICLSVSEKEQVDNICAIAEKKGGKADPTKLPEVPGMYGRSFEDPDGHIWELMWMDPNITKQECEANLQKKTGSV